jgi:hypothetical protein
MAASAHYVVHVVDEVDERLAGHYGCSYTSPPQPADAALELVRALGGCTQRAERGPWQMAVAGGRRTITVVVAHPDGQLLMGER